MPPVPVVQVLTMDQRLQGTWSSLIGFFDQNPIASCLMYNSVLCTWQGFSMVVLTRQKKEERGAAGQKAPQE